MVVGYGKRIPKSEWRKNPLTKQDIKELKNNGVDHWAFDEMDIDND